MHVSIVSAAVPPLQLMAAGDDDRRGWITLPHMTHIATPAECSGLRRGHCEFGCFAELAEAATGRPTVEIRARSYDLTE